MGPLDTDFFGGSRPFPRWFTAQPGLGTQTDGNAVTIHVGGDQAFPDIARALRTVGAGNFLYVAGWFLDPDCALDKLPTERDPTTPRALLKRANDAGAEVRVLLAKNPTSGSGGPFGIYDNNPPVNFVNGLTNRAAVLDDRVPRPVPIIRRRSW